MARCQVVGLQQAEQGRRWRAAGGEPDDAGARVSRQRQRCGLARRARWRCGARWRAQGRATPRAMAPAHRACRAEADNACSRARRRRFGHRPHRRSRARSRGRWRPRPRPRRWRSSPASAASVGAPTRLKSRFGAKLLRSARACTRGRRCQALRSTETSPLFVSEAAGLMAGTVPTIGMGNAFRSARRPTVEAVLQASTMQSGSKSSICFSNDFDKPGGETPAHFEP